MKPLLTAQSLWNLWVREQTIPETAATFPFYDRVQALLEAGQLQGVLNAVFEMADQLRPGDLLFPMVTQIHRMAQWVTQSDGPGEHFHTQLVAIPLGGPTEALGDGRTLWEGVEGYLQQRFRARTRRRGQASLGLTITPFPALLAPEVCAALTLDEVYALTREMGQGRGRTVTDTLLKTQHTLESEGTAGEAADGQRLAVAVITHNADQLPAREGLDDWLSELDPADWLWQRHLAMKTQWALPPMPLTEALIETLWQRVEGHVERSCLERGLVAAIAEIQWAEVIEDEDTDRMNLVVQADEQRLPALQVPGAWFSLIGPEAIDRFLHMWDEEVEGALEEETPAVVVTENNVTSMAERRRAKAGG